MKPRQIVISNPIETPKNVQIRITDLKQGLTCPYCFVKLKQLSDSEAVCQNCGREFFRRV